MIWVALSTAAVTFEPIPAEGVETVVTVTEEESPAQGETVRVTYRPGTPHETERAIGITDGRGRVRWTPEVGGVSRLRVGDQIEPVKVRWESPPASATVLLGILWLCSLGFALTGLRKVARR